MGIRNGMIMVWPFLFDHHTNALPRNRRIGDYGFWTLKAVKDYDCYFRCCVHPLVSLNYQPNSAYKTFKKWEKEKAHLHTA